MSLHTLETADMFSVRSAKLNEEVSIAYTTAGEFNSKKAILLIHGYPQTVYAMRFLLPLLAKEGYFVVAPDYRGAGGSSMPLGGYDKFTMSKDLDDLMRNVLKIKEYNVLGHDIGSMIATSQAFQFQNHIKSLIIMECPQPGTSVYHDFITKPELTMGPTFHFFFHNSKDLPEQLTIGKEDLYIQHFFDRLSFKPYFLSKKDQEVYYNSFRKSGRMRAGFELYRSFQKDDEQIKSHLNQFGKLKIPILATGGKESVFCNFIERIANEIGEKVEFIPIPDASHWVPEENPTGLAQTTIEFLKKNGC